jgi:hypothetical protein
LPVIVYLGIQLGILYRDGSLVGKTAQYCPVVGGESGVPSENDDDTHHALACDQWQGKRGEPAHSSRLCQLGKKPVDHHQLTILGVFVFGNLSELRLDIPQESRWQTLADIDPPPLRLIAKSDQTRLTGKHLQ